MNVTVLQIGIWVDLKYEFLPHLIQFKGVSTLFQFHRAPFHRALFHKTGTFDKIDKPRTRTNHHS